MSAVNAPRFATIYDAAHKKLHVGVVMGKGGNWVEISVPLHFDLTGRAALVLHPATEILEAVAETRSSDRIRFSIIQRP